MLGKLLLGNETFCTDHMQQLPKLTYVFKNAQKLWHDNPGLSPGDEWKKKRTYKNRLGQQKTFTYVEFGEAVLPTVNTWQFYDTPYSMCIPRAFMLTCVLVFCLVHFHKTYLGNLRHLQTKFVRQFEDKRDPQIHETGSYMHGRRGGKLENFQSITRDWILNCKHRLALVPWTGFSPLD